MLPFTPTASTGGILYLRVNNRKVSGPSGGGDDWKLSCYSATVLVSDRYARWRHGIQRCVVQWGVRRVVSLSCLTVFVPAS